MSAAVRIERFRALKKNTLRGFADVLLPSGMRLHDVAIHYRNGNAWAQPTSKPVLDRDGKQITDPGTGKLRWTPIVSFTDRATSDKFSAVVLEALRREHPEAFKETEALS